MRRTRASTHSRAVCPRHHPGPPGPSKKSQAFARRFVRFASHHVRKQDTSPNCHAFGPQNGQGSSEREHLFTPGALHRGAYRGPFGDPPHLTGRDPRTAGEGGLCFDALVTHGGGTGSSELGPGWVDGWIQDAFGEKSKPPFFGHQGLINHARTARLKVQAQHVVGVFRSS